MKTKTKSKALLTAFCLTALSAAGPAVAQRDRWESLRVEEDCIGGSRCGGSRNDIRIPLDGGAVYGIRFRAHDNVGDNSRGHLRVRLDDRVLERDIDVAKNGEWYEVDARGARGRYLIFEAIADDEVVIEEVEIETGRGTYGRDRYRDDDRNRDRYRDRYRNDDRYRDRNDRGRGRGRGYSRSGDWESYPEAQGCIGGAQCGRTEEIRVRLDDRPVEAIRFHAHDNRGDNSRGRLRVSIDGQVLEQDIDVAKDGEVYEIDGRNVRGRYLILNSFAHDEVIVDDVEVLYRGRANGRR